MSNGAQCCALEICCPPSERRQKLTAMIVAFTGAEESHCEGFLDWMAHEDLIFAPSSFSQTIADIAAATKKHHDA